MSTIDEVLAAAEVVDAVCIIDGETRIISVPTEYKELGVESDEKVTRVKFQCPKIVGDNIDLTEYNLYINYKNASNKLNSYLVEDITVTGDTINFSWLLSRHVTESPGAISYIVCAKKSDDTGVINEWNTKVATGTVGIGLEATEEIEEQNIDAIEQILRSIVELENKVDGGGSGGSSIAIDETLTEQGKAADAKATGDAIRSLSEEIANLQTSGLTTAQVNALDGMFKVCAFTKDNVSAEYNAFRTAFGIESATITGISATYSGGNVTAGTSVDELTGIVVTANYSDGSTQTVTGYTLSGTIAEGSNTITVTYEGMTTTFTVTGVAEEVTLTSISVTYSGGDVAVGTAVADLTGIVVTAHYSDGTSQTVTGYTLSGAIAEGSNTVTVTYQGKTATFTVTGVAESVEVSNETTWTDGVAYTYTTVKDEYLETNGTLTAYPSWDRTPYLYCADASKLRVVVKHAMSSIPGSAQYNGFFDENKNFISQFKYNTIDKDTVGAYVDVSVPADAVYFIASGVKTVITDYLGNGPAVSFIPYE